MYWYSQCQILIKFNFCVLILLNLEHLPQSIFKLNFLILIKAVQIIKLNNHKLV